MNKDALLIKIEDNGIGRNAAGIEKGDSTGLGIKILDKINEHLNRNSKRKISQKIIDLKDDNGSAAGTRIEIEIPVQFRN
jgi:hypothetical protein